MNPIWLRDLIDWLIIKLMKLQMIKGCSCRDVTHNGKNFKYTYVISKINELEEQ